MCRCVSLCASAYHFHSLCLLCHNVCMPFCVCVSLLLPSSFFSVLCAQNEPPTTQKQRADRGFFIWLKDYIIRFSGLCVHIRAHTKLVADGGRLHTCTRHTFTVSLLLTQIHFEHVQADSANTDVHMHTLSGDTRPPPLPL